MNSAMEKEYIGDTKNSLPTNWEALKEQAEVLVKSGFLPATVNTPEKAIAIALTAKELGIGMMEGFRSINVIQGKPTISPQLMLAMANRTKQLKDITIDANDDRCVVVVTREGRQPHCETFGVKEATDLGLMLRDNYKKQRATMFKWRALAANLRVTFPDVMIGFYTPEEMGATVKIGDGEEMEVIHETEYDTGVRPPAGWLALSKDDPAKAQEIIGGKDYYVKNTPKGRMIFTKEKPDLDFLDTSSAKPQPEPQKKAPDSLISVEYQTELVRLCKERGITQEAFKAYLKETYGINGWSKIQDKDYDTIYAWLITHDSKEVGQ